MADLSGYDRAFKQEKMHNVRMKKTRRLSMNLVAVTIVSIVVSADRMSGYSQL